MLCFVVVPLVLGNFFLVSAISACSFETRGHREMGTTRERALFEARRVLFGRLDSYVAASSDLEIAMIQMSRLILKEAARFRGQALVRITGVMGVSLPLL